MDILGYLLCENNFRFYKTEWVIFFILGVLLFSFFDFLYCLVPSFLGLECAGSFNDFSRVKPFLEARGGLAKSQ